MTQVPSFQKLPDDIIYRIHSGLKPRDSNNLRSTNRANIQLSKVPLYYSTNHINFRKAYSDAVQFASAQTSLISRKKPTLDSLIVYYSNVSDNIIPTITLSNNKRYVLSQKDYSKVQIFNKGILIYLQILKKGVNYNHYIYGLAQVISHKSRLSDVFSSDRIKKYRIIEFELYKLYVVSYLLQPTSKYNIEYLKDATYMIKYYSKAGIPGYVTEAHPKQLLCSTFMHYYFNNTEESLQEFLKLASSFTKNPIRSINKDKLLKYYLNFMIIEEKSISTFTKQANDVDLSLIDLKEDYKRTYLSTLKNIL